MDQKNEMFAEWKKALVSGEFQKAQYFRDAFFALDFSENNLEKIKDENSSLNKSLRDEQEKVKTLVNHSMSQETTIKKLEKDFSSLQSKYESLMRDNQKLVSTIKSAKK